MSYRHLVAMGAFAIAVCGTSVCGQPPSTESSAPRDVVDGGSKKAVANAKSSGTRIGEQLQDLIRAEVRQKQIPAFAISVVAEGRVVWSSGFGHRDAANEVPCDAETVFRVGSVSKLFTDIAVMQLVEQGRLDLDAPVQQYLPDFSPKNQFDVAITLRQLMSHRSGLVREPPVGNYFDPIEPTLAETVSSLNETALVYRPDSKTKYSNAAVAVVGAVLESRLDEPFARHVRSSILAPLQMRDSDFELTPAIKSQLADAEMWTYGGRRFPAPRFGLGTSSAGNLYSSVEDLSRFMLCLFDDGRVDDQVVIRPETVEAMITPSKDRGGKALPFGLGFHVDEFEGHRRVGHGGAVYGFSTQFSALPDQEIGVVAVAALDGSNGWVKRVCDHALRLLLADRQNRQLPKFETSEPVPPARANELVGTYQNSNGLARITSLHDRLFLWFGDYRYELRARSADGAIVTDDPLGHGIRVRVDDRGDLHVGGDRYRPATEVPPAPPQRWQGLIGEYGWDHNTLFILEQRGKLYALIEWFYLYPLEEIDDDTFAFPDRGLYHGEKLHFHRHDGVATKVVAAEVTFDRRQTTAEGATFKIEPLHPIEQLREQALAAKPPAEERRNPPDLVDMVSLDDSIRTDIRYATTNNFMGAVFYQQPRAFMQRPAAEAVVRVHQRLADQDLGLLIHDAYRPWFVTKMFWDATPGSMKDFVANPQNGSRHNRGCAVDLTLYRRSTGEPITMVSGYDEFSFRSLPEYPGGNDRQRSYRSVLRAAMESEGFRVYEFEWWHFDFEQWQSYPIMNVTFEQIDQSR